MTVAMTITSHTVLHSADKNMNTSWQHQYLSSSSNWRCSCLDARCIVTSAAGWITVSHFLLHYQPVRCLDFTLFLEQQLGSCCSNKVGLPFHLPSSLCSWSSSSAHAAATRSGSRFICHAQLATLAQLSTTGHLQVVPVDIQMSWFGTWPISACALQRSMVILGCDHWMTISCSSHGQVQSPLVCVFPAPLDKHAGTLYPLHFVIWQSHWDCLGRRWNHFYRATHMHSADYAVARCLTVCPSVTRRYCV